MRNAHRLAAASIGLAALFAVGVAPSAAIADEGAASSECTVTGGTLTWGVKEAFRSYISGAIAKGSWAVSDGASYATPNFSWEGASGSINADSGEGLVHFTGTIVFTGHNGVLNLQFANPTVRLRGDGSADLLLDAKSNNAEGALVVDALQVPTGRIDDLGVLAPESGTIAVTKAPVLLTADGAKSFADFYATGDDLDPVTLNVTLGSCAASASKPGAPSGTEQPGDIMTTQAPPGGAKGGESAPGVPWLPIIIGGAAIVIIGAAAALLFTGRRTPAAGGAGADETATREATDPSTSTAERDTPPRS